MGKGISGGIRRKRNGKKGQTMGKGIERETIGGKRRETQRGREGHQKGGASDTIELFRSPALNVGPFRRDATFRNVKWASFDGDSGVVILELFSKIF